MIAALWIMLLAHTYQRVDTYHLKYTIFQIFWTNYSCMRPDRNLDFKPADIFIVVIICTLQLELHCIRYTHIQNVASLNGQFRTDLRWLSYQYRIFSMKTTNNSRIQRAVYSQTTSGHSWTFWSRRKFEECTEESQRWKGNKWRDKHNLCNTFHTIATWNSASYLKIKSLLNSKEREKKKRYM